MVRDAHEHTINVKVGEALGQLGKSWTVSVEPNGMFADGTGRADILIEKQDGWPVILEAEVANYAKADDEAKSRIGRELVDSTSSVHAAVALVYPKKLRNSAEVKKLEQEIPSAEFEYALYTMEADKSKSRFPSQGWIKGDIKDLAGLVHRSSVPAWRVKTLSDSLDKGIRQAEGEITRKHPINSDLGKRIGNILIQQNKDSEQTRLMAMVVVTDAFIFHSALSDVQMTVDEENPRPVKSPIEFKSGNGFSSTRLLDEWKLILEVNYSPIFETARQIVECLPPAMASDVLNKLWNTTEEMIIGGVTKSHDLTGSVFQRLITDRKFLAAYYTRPASASLLAGMAMHSQNPCWSDAEALKSMRIGDFACGTGTLLSAAYNRLGILHEMSGGNPKELHADMMEHGLVGLDVLVMGVHLTSATLAGAYPDTPFSGECLLTMPYGEYKWGLSVGSLDLLTKQPSFDVMQNAAKSSGGRGAKDATDYIQKVGHEQFDLVIMNPPYINHGKHEGETKNTHNPAFAAFELDEATQDKLSQYLSKKLAAGGCGHGHAGMGTYFLDLGDRKVKPGGRLALVLLSSIMQGGAWRKCRKRIVDYYHDITVVSATGPTSVDQSFSQDTVKAEVLITGTKNSQKSNATPRGNFVFLESPPKSVLEGEQISRALEVLIDSGSIPELESGPFGGADIWIGDVSYGKVINAEIPRDTQWPLAGVRDITLAQSAWQLQQGKLWIEGMSQQEICDIPVDTIGNVITGVGSHHLDITGKPPKGSIIPQGPFDKFNGYRQGAGYHALWNNNAPTQRSIEVLPDHYLEVRTVNGKAHDTVIERADKQWKKASRVHYNCGVRFNSMSLVVAMTQMKSLGGSVYPTLSFDNEQQEAAFALWCNSTLGILCHWWLANKGTVGKASSTHTSIQNFPTLDVKALCSEQLSNAEKAFDDVRNNRMLPIHQIDHDAARHDLDRRILIDVLGLPQEICDDGGPIDRLRLKMSIEPQIRGTKKTGVQFTDEGETKFDRELPY